MKHLKHGTEIETLKNWASYRNLRTEVKKFSVLCILIQKIQILFEMSLYLSSNVVICRQTLNKILLTRFFVLSHYGKSSIKTTMAKLCIQKRQNVSFCY